MPCGTSPIWCLSRADRWPIGKSGPKRFNRTDEDPEAVANVRKCTVAAGPSRMMPGFDESFGMGHQAEDPAGRVADARDGPRRAVGVGRIILGRMAVAVGVFQDDLSGTVEHVESRSDRP